MHVPTEGLAPDSPDDVDAIRELLATLPFGAWPGDAFVDSVATASPCPVLRGEARLVRAMHVHEHQAPDAAEAAYVDGFALAWGSGGAIERQAVANFTMLCVGQQRPFEVLVLSGRGIAMSHGSDPYFEALARLDRTAAFAQLGDWDRMRVELDAVARLSDVLAGRQQLRVTCTMHVYRVSIAFELDDAPMAEQSMLQLDELFQAVGAPRTPDSMTLGLRAQAALVTGRHEEAVRLATQRRAVEPSWDENAADTDLIEVRALFALGHAEQGLAAAHALLDRLESGSGRRIAPGMRLETARFLARTVADRDSGLARRALAVAAAAALERIWQRDSFSRRLYPFERLDTADRAILDEYQARFVGEYGDVLDEVARLLADPDALSSIIDGETSDRIIGVCAWCHRLRGPQAVWIDLGHYEPPEGGVEVTHTACESCFESVLSGMNAPLS